MDYRLENVEALWPRIDKAYAWDEAKGMSVDTLPTDTNGAYEMTVIMNDDQAKDLAAKMKEVFNSDEKTKGKQWVITKEAPGTGLEAQKVVKSLEDIFTKSDGVYRAKLKMPTYGDPRTKPKQYMGDGTPAAEDFQLTSGSIVHVMFRIKTWAYGKRVGIGLRPTGVMVVRLAEPQEAPAGEMFEDLIEADPLKDTLMGKALDDNALAEPAKTEAVNPFGETEQKEEQKIASNDMDDEIPF
jgi:hypothetical protein